MGSENKVARILKTYGILNGICALIIGIIMMSDYDGFIGIIVFAAGLVASFLIYAFGEVVQLLHDIRRNTAVSVEIQNSNSGDNELPDI